MARGVRVEEDMIVEGERRRYIVVGMVVVAKLLLLSRGLLGSTTIRCKQSWGLVDLPGNRRPRWQVLGDSSMCFEGDDQSVAGLGIG